MYAEFILSPLSFKWFSLNRCLIPGITSFPTLILKSPIIIIHSFLDIESMTACNCSKKAIFSGLCLQFSGTETEITFILL